MESPEAAEESDVMVDNSDIDYTQDSDETDNTSSDPDFVVDASDGNTCLSKTSRSGGNAWVDSGQTVSDKCKQKGQEGKRFECDVCKKTFNQLINLTTHMRTHTGEKPFKCSVCHKMFGYYVNLTTHMRLHTGEKPYKCDVCQRTFTHSNTLKMHKRIHTGERPYKCTVCAESFLRHDQLKRHMSGHTGVKPYNCQMCGKSFTQIDSWKMHMEKHAEVKPYECGVCHKNFASVVTLKRHMRNHEAKTFKCDKCDKEYVFKAELKRHIAAQHTTERPYKCSICEKSFPVAVNLTNHMLSHTGEKPYKCPFCDKRFSSASYMGAHKRQQHTKERLHNCSECGKCFPHPTSLKKHMNIHFGKKNHVCSICSKAFLLQGSLRIHMRTHSGEKPYSCHLCSKAFQHLKTLNRHMEIHYDSLLLTSGQVKLDIGQGIPEKIKNGKTKTCLKCPFCLKEFSYLKHFRSHMSLHPEAASVTNSEECGLESVALVPVKTGESSQENTQVPDECVQVKTEYEELEMSSVGPNLVLHPPPSVSDVQYSNRTSDSLAVISKLRSKLFRKRKAQTVSNLEETMFKCPACGLVSDNVQFLNTHMKLHSNTDSRQQKRLKPFKCTVCRKAFVLLKSLRKHMKRHLNSPKNKPKETLLSSQEIPQNDTPPENTQRTLTEETMEPVPRSPGPLLKKTPDPLTQTPEPLPRSPGPLLKKTPDPLTQTPEPLPRSAGPLLKKTPDPRTQTTEPLPRTLGPLPRLPELLLKKTPPEPLLRSSDPLPRMASESPVVKAKGKARGEPVRCTVCDRGFVYLKSLNKHMRDHSIAVTFPCKICGERFKDKVTLKAHTENHELTTSQSVQKPMDIKPCVCQQCGKVFSDLVTLNNHIISHEPLGSVEPQVCDRPTVENYSTGHVTDPVDIKPFRSNECPEIFETAHALRSQEAVAHAHAPALSSVKACPSLNCGEMFSEAASLSSHEASHVNERRDAGEAPQVPNDFRRRRNLMHPEGESRGKGVTFHCYTCNNNFSDSLSLNEHQKIHRPPSHKIENEFLRYLHAQGELVAQKLTMT